MLSDINNEWSCGAALKCVFLERCPAEPCLNESEAIRNRFLWQNRQHERIYCEKLEKSTHVHQNTKRRNLPRTHSDLRWFGLAVSACSQSFSKNCQYIKHTIFHVIENVIRIFQHWLKELRHTRLPLSKPHGSLWDQSRRAWTTPYCQTLVNTGPPPSQSASVQWWDERTTEPPLMESSFRDPSISGGGHQAEDRAFSCLIGPLGSQSIS